MTTSVEVKIVHANPTRLIIAGIILLLLGLMSICSPLASGMAVAVLVGALVLVAGLAQAVHAHGHQHGFARIVGYVGAALSVLCGAIMLLHPMFGLGFLTLLLIAYFLGQGLVTMIWGFKLKPLRGWGWVVSSGVLSLLLGLLFWRQWPVSGAWAIGTLIGVQMLLFGWSALILGLGVKETLRAS